MTDLLGDSSFPKKMLKQNNFLKSPALQMQLFSGIFCLDFAKL
jgi:hypothetical protein